MVEQKTDTWKRVVLVLGLVLFFTLLGVTGYFFFVRSPALPKHEEEEHLPVMEEPKVKIVDVENPQPVFAVMINNISVARPLQSGLQDAFLVYEMVVEGGITRYMALFTNQQTQRIGPVRSARPYYLDYVMENEAIYAHYGYSEQARQEISQYHISNINGLSQSGAYWRDNSLNVALEHRAFTSMKLLTDAASTLGYSLQRDVPYVLSYSATEIPLDLEEILPAVQVDIPYSSGTTSSYTYLEDEGVYARYVNHSPHLDYVTKEQYKVKNILTYQVKNYAVDSYGRQALDTVGSGDGYYITMGKAIPIHWEKSSREAKTKYTYLNGEEVLFNDGNTWIQIQPTSQKLTIS